MRMYNNILLCLSSLINVVGTVYAVLSILGIKASEVYRSITLEGMDERDAELIIQKEQAVIGIPLVVLGWLGQTAFTFIEINCMQELFISIFVIIIAVFIEVLASSKFNNHFREKYNKLRESKARNKESTHENLHTWKEI